MTQNMAFERRRDRVDTFFWGLQSSGSRIKCRNGEGRQEVWALASPRVISQGPDIPWEQKE